MPASVARKECRTDARPASTLARAAVNRKEQRMHCKTMKMLATGALVAAALGGASSTSANWTTNGSFGGTLSSFTAGPSRLAVQPVGGAAQGISCPSGSLQMNLQGPSLATGNGIATGLTLGFKRQLGFPTVECTVVGQSAAVKCASSGALNAVSYAPVGGVTSGSITGISCVIAKLSGACGNATTFNATGSATGAGITLTGSVTGTYGNTTQQITVSTTGQALATSWTSTGCLQGTGTGTAVASLTNSSGTALVYGWDFNLRPNITN
jgi:hypothetical protein